MTISEEQLSRWAKPPSETEEGKCQTAVSQITKAVRAKFGNEVSIFLQGSYKNRTNVRLDSDVDIVVRHDGYYFPDVSGMSEETKKTYWSGFIPTQYTYENFKNDMHNLLSKEFGSNAVERKNKCVMVKANPQRVKADVVPCFVHNRYGESGALESEGIELVSDGGEKIYSFPEQHYDNGVLKNNATSRSYKSVVRILKNVRNDLIEQRKITPEAMPSFLLECLVWNVLPHTHFTRDTYTDATRAIIATVWNEMRVVEKANSYAEVSELKWLFKGHNNRTHKQALDFMQLAWNFIGYEN